MIPLRLYMWAALLVAVVAFSGAGHWQAHSLRAELATVKSRAVADALTATTAALALSESRARRDMEIENASTKTRASLALARSAAAAAGNGLRIRAAAAWASCDPAPTVAADSAPASAAGDLLADMQRGLIEAAEQLATIADERGAAGAECVARSEPVGP